MKRTLRIFCFASVGLLPLVAMPVACAATFNATSIADAYVASGPTGNLRNNNYGGGGALAVAAASLPNGEFQSVIKFDLSAARNSFDTQYGPGGWSIASISLQLSSSPHSNPIYNEVGAGNFNVSLMQNNSWVEGTGNASNPSANGLTFNSLQSTFINPALDQSLGTFTFNGGTAGANQYSLTLAPGLTSDLMNGANASVRLFAADNSVSYLFGSRAATPASSQPQLVILAVPEPATWALCALGFAVLLWRGSLARPASRA